MHIFHSRENIKTCIFTAVKIQDLIFSRERNRKIGTTFFYFVKSKNVFHFTREVEIIYISFVASPLMKYKYCPLHS